MNCYHCGAPCEHNTIQINNRSFCCQGCHSVYDILHKNGLDQFYELGKKSPGVKQRENEQTVYFDFLDLEEYQNQLILYTDKNLNKIQLYLPQIHCNSCIYLLENLSKINSEILSGEVNFTHKTIQITAKKSYSLKELALFLTQLGYPPDFTPVQKREKKQHKQIIYKIGVAGFCFGNIMLFSFPEYLGLAEGAHEFRKLFLYLSFLLSLPVLFYAGFDYLKYAYYGLKNRVFNMELPIAIGLITLFLRSTYELIDFNSQAYFDSLAGLIFFLLIGKWYQEKTFSSLRFKTDKRSYFPMAVQVITANKVSICNTENLNIGMHLLIRNYELIPTDTILLEESALIDYSFVTGESEPIKIKSGEVIFAGGRLIGSPCKMQVIKNLNDGYLMGLWNTQYEKPVEKENRLTQISNKISRYFTLFILILSIATATYWYFIDISLLWPSVVAVLIIACPCALALSIPFTYGNALSVFGKAGLYFRKSKIIDQLTGITAIVFDKTGTLTTGKKAKVIQHGNFTLTDQLAIFSGCSNSYHPLSQSIATYLNKSSPSPIESFKEYEGAGIEFNSMGNIYRIGSSIFTTTEVITHQENATCVYVTKNSELVGYFTIEHTFRPQLSPLINILSKRYKIYLLSGDNDQSASFIKNQFEIDNLKFNQTPQQKAIFIRQLQSQGEKVLMLGDGINDGQALKESYFGIAISNSSQSFKPSSDAILKGKSLIQLANFLDFARFCKKTVVASFIISLLYNVIGLTIAVQGILAPVLAAILMPLSSLSVVLFASLSILIYSKTITLHQK